MKFFNLHTHIFSNSKDILELVNQYPNEYNNEIQYYSTGIHPWYINESLVQKELLIIDKRLKNANCLALGECGLDKRIATDFALQKTVFEAQIDLAQKHQKPIIVHCVAAYQELIEIKKKKKITVPMVIHGFSKNLQIANQLLSEGFYLSFGKYLLQNPELEIVFCNIPSDRFFLETDTINEPIQSVYEKAMQYKNCSPNDLYHIIAQNCKNVFNIEL